MKNIPTIQAYTLKWHLEKTRSHEFLVVKSLAPYVKIFFHSWDGITFNEKK